MLVWIQWLNYTDRINIFFKTWQINKNHIIFYCLHGKGTFDGMGPSMSKPRIFFKKKFRGGKIVMLNRASKTFFASVLVVDQIGCKKLSDEKSGKVEVDFCEFEGRLKVYTEKARRDQKSALKRLKLVALDLRSKMARVNELSLNREA